MSNPLNERVQASCFGYIFNATKHGFMLEKVADNFLSVFQELVVATIPCEDDTRERLSILQKKYGNRVKVVDSQVSVSSNRFDGDLKTEAMNNCSFDVRIIMDFDEMCPVYEHTVLMWKNIVNFLNSEQCSNLDGFFIPVVDLYGDKDHIKDSPLGVKFRIHKKSIVKRGVPNFAQLPNGLIDTSKSDTTEAILGDGNLGKFANIIQPQFFDQKNTHLLFHAPFFVHFGFLDLNRRANLGKTFWAEKWEDRSGKKENVATEIKELTNTPVIKHNIDLKGFFDQ